MHYLVKDVCKRFKLSRSALLYYDTIGLLKAAGRSKNNYRRYSEEDLQRLEQIRIYRQAGLHLEEIKGILDTPESDISVLLEKRLEQLNEEIKNIRNQQHLIVSLLKNRQLLDRVKLIDRDSLVETLSQAGFNEEGMTRLHAELERTSPEAHQKFLESLFIDNDEIEQIRLESRNYYDNDSRS